MFLDELPPWFVTLTAVALGLCFGSFLNVVVYRLPRGMSLAHPPSACPGCGKPIAAYNNVPVLAWLWLGGKAQCCKTPISVRYPVVELLGGLLAWAVVETRLVGNGDLPVGEALLLFTLYYTLTMALLAAALIDLEHMILPDSLTLGGLLLGLASSPWRPEVDLVTSVMATIGGFVGIWVPFIWGYEKLRGMQGMGMGDAKLVALAGAWFGPLGILFTLFVGAVQGTVAALVLVIFKGKIELPDAVEEERRQLLEDIENAEGELREQLEEQRANDPVMQEGDGSLMKSHLPFGPFLVLALLELTFFYETIEVYVSAWLLGF